jgi:tetratricopeptide (TPR) repeat protein
MSDFIDVPSNERVMGLLDRTQRFYDLGISRVVKSPETFPSLVQLIDDIREVVSMPMNPEFATGLRLELSSLDTMAAHTIAANGIKDGDHLVDPTPYLEEALEINPEFGSAWHVLGRHQGMVGRIKDSIYSLEQAVKHYPGHMGAHKDLGTAYMNDGQYLMAIMQITYSMRDSEDMHLKFLNRADAFIHMHMYDAALQDVESAKSLDEDHPAFILRSLRMEGDCLRLLGNQNAVLTYEKAIEQALLCKEVFGDDPYSSEEGYKAELGLVRMGVKPKVTFDSDVHKIGTQAKLNADFMLSSSHLLPRYASSGNDML